jgi:plastocyanin
MPSNSEASLSNSGDETIGRHGGSAASCFLVFASASRSAEPRVYIIEIDNLAFGPTPEGLRVNDIVKWTNVDIFRHTAGATDRSFDFDLSAEERRAGRL